MEKDPWDKPCKIVIKKLKSSLSGLYETMKEVVKEIVSSLFPMRQSILDSNVPAVGSEEEIPSVILEKCIRRINENKKAPGPDGIINTILACIVGTAGGARIKGLNWCLQEGFFPFFL